METLLFIVALLSLSIWAYLLLARGDFWRVQAFDADNDPAESSTWPSVVAIVPARNEAATIGRTIASLSGQDYPGTFSIILVDDHSEDATAEIARRSLEARRGASLPGQASRVTIRAAAELPPGWTGKVWAMAQGVYRAAAAPPDYYWFTDADVLHGHDTLRRLIARAERDKFDLASLMVLLQSYTLAERALIPAFLYFFLKLYPPRWIADPEARTAGAAGGCILLRRKALEDIGGMSAIRGELIDDCALARAVKRSGGRIWMGLTRKSISLRAYKSLREIQDMIARLAFTQLRYSAVLLAGALAGMFLTYLAPICLLFADSLTVRTLALAAWALMSLSFLPTVRFYRLSAAWALSLALAALFYSYATCVSAIRYWLARGGQWKGRAQAPKPV